MTKKFVKELVDLLIYSKCHLLGVVGALEATQAMTVLWAYTDYDPSSVAI
jgi:hypothetical protein